MNTPQQSESEGGDRALVVEDDTNARRMMTHILKRAGLEPIEARDGVEAVQFADSKKPDVILMDVMMPRLDGLNAMRRIRANPGTSHIPVIVCSARDSREDIVTAMKAGAEDYIIKPFRSETYLQKIWRVLKSHARRSAILNPGSEQRKSKRYKVDWRAIWSIMGPDGKILQSVSPVYDVSKKGIGLELDFCDNNEMMKKHTFIEDQNPDGAWRRLKRDQAISVSLIINRGTVVDIQGEVAHVFSPKDRPGIEIAGIRFTRVSSLGKRMIEEHTA